MKAIKSFSFPVGPLIVVNAFSLYWYWFDAHPAPEQSQPSPIKRQGGRAQRRAREAIVWLFRALVHLVMQANTLR